MQKSLTELREIAQAAGVKFSFGDSAEILAKEIEIARINLTPEPPVIPDTPVYDARLMTAAPAAIGNQEELKRLLSEHISRGLRLTFPDQECWQVGFNKKTDTGTMRMPLRDILKCAERVMI